MASIPHFGDSVTVRIGGVPSTREFFDFIDTASLAGFHVNIFNNFVISLSIFWLYSYNRDFKYCDSSVPFE